MSVQFDTTTNSLKLVQEAAGSSGVVSLAFNKDQTVLVGAGYGEGRIDVWNVSESNGKLEVGPSTRPRRPTDGA